MARLALVEFGEKTSGLPFCSVLYASLQVGEEVLKHKNIAGAEKRMYGS